MFGKSIELFLESGDPSGIITARFLQRNGRVVKIPRIAVATCDIEGIDDAGAYMLFCQDDEEESCYIGESEHVRNRIVQHLRDFKSGKEEYYWKTAVLFLGEDLDKANIRYLENRFVEMANECKNYRIITRNTCKNIVLRQSQIASMEEYIQNAKILISTLGYNIFDQPQKPTDNTTYFFCKQKDADAKGFLSNGGLTVLKGSQITSETAASFKDSSYYNLRNTLIKNGDIKDSVFQKDYEFSSPSAASAVVCGRHSNGNIDWKTDDGVRLKDSLNNEE